MTQVIPIQSPTVVNHYRLKRHRSLCLALSTGFWTLAENDDILAKTEASRRYTRHYSRIGCKRCIPRLQFERAYCGLRVLLVYLVLVAQFKSFIDPLMILLAVPPASPGLP